MPWNEPRAPVSPVDTSTVDFAHAAAAGYARIRAEGPIVWQRESRGFLLTRYADAAAALRDKRLKAPDLAGAWTKLSVKLNRDYTDAIKLFSFMPFVLEGERHQHLRRALAYGVAPFAGGTVEFDEVIQRTLAGALKDGGFDLAADFGAHLLFEIMCDLMRISREERAELKPLATLSYALETMLPVAKRDVAADHIKTALFFLRRRAREAMAETDNPSLLRAIYSALPPDELDKHDAVATIAAVIMVMGNDALGACITFAVRHLKLATSQSTPRQSSWESIADDAIRFAAPIDFINRIADQDLTIAGCRIQRGERVVVSPLCANHDVLEFGANAGCISPRPSGSVGLTFGAGSHQCVGNRFSRTIVRKAFAALAALPEFRISGAVRYGPGKIIRSLTSMPVAFA